MKITKPVAAGIAAAVLIAAIGISMTVSGISNKAKAASAAAERTETVFAVSTTTAARGELKDYLEFGGDVNAKTNIDILPDTAGRIVEVRVRVGDSVERNQVIALVDPSRPGMNYESSPVKAPISGTVTSLSIVAGSMVSPQLSTGKVSKMDSLEITTNVPERYVSKIREGLEAYLRFDAYPGETFRARVTEVSPVLDTSSRTMSVKLVQVQSDPRIKAGMFARIKLITDTRTNIVKIPDTAVVSRFGESFVFVVTETPDAAAEDSSANDSSATDNTDGADSAAASFRVRKQIVVPGIRVDDKIEILSGLTAGEEVVIRGQSLLEDGSPINIVSRLPALSAMETIK